MKIYKRLTPALRSQFRLEAGDTIVEVMLSMVVLAVVIGAAYLTSTRAFQASLDSQERDQAVSYAQQQIELLKNADNSHPSTIDAYTRQSLSGGFCINPSTMAASSASSTSCTLNSLYKESVVYNSSIKTFAVSVSWDSAINGAPNQTLIYYKANDSWVDNGQSCPGSCTTSTVTNPPAAAVNVYATPTAVSYGGSVNITWDTLNVTSGSCNAQSNPTSAGWNGAKADVNLSPGQNSASLGTPGSVVFTLTCKDLAGKDISGSANAAVAGPPTPVVTTGTASAVTAASASLNGIVNPNGRASTYWFNYGTGTSYGTSTPSNSAGNDSIDHNVSTSISGLNPSTTYHFQLCASNSAGTACGGDSSFTTPVPPPTVQITSISYYWTDNGNLQFYGTVNDHNIPGTTAWFEESCFGGWNGSDHCNNYGAFPTPAQAVVTNNSANPVTQHVYPWTFYYWGYHDPYYFRICAQNAGGTACSSTYSLY